MPSNNLFLIDVQLTAVLLFPSCHYKLSMTYFKINSYIFSNDHASIAAVDLPKQHHEAKGSNGYKKAFFTMILRHFINEIILVNIFFNMPAEMKIVLVLVSKIFTNSRKLLTYGYGGSQQSRLDRLRNESALRLRNKTSFLNGK